MLGLWLAAFTVFGVGAGALDAQDGTLPQLHHAHLNTTDVDAAIEWYLSVWPDGERGEVAGFPAFRAEMALLFNRVATPPTGGWNDDLQRADPQSAFWHIGGFVNTTDLFERLESDGVEVLRLETGPGQGPGVVRSGLTPYSGIHGAESLQSVEPSESRPGGFGYVVGPDGALVELTGSPRTNPSWSHVHLFHENPRCAANWYVDVLGFRHAPYRDPSTGERAEREEWAPCEADRGDRGWPSLEAAGTVRAPSATVVHRGGSISSYPRQCTGSECATTPPLSPSSGQVLDHVAFSIPGFSAWLESAQNQNVVFLSDVYDFGGVRAVMIEGPDGLSIEVIEEAGR